jgi:hypothetical protein
MAGEGAHQRGAGAGEGDGLRGGGLVCRSRFGLKRFVRLSPCGLWVLGFVGSGLPMWLNGPTWFLLSHGVFHRGEKKMSFIFLIMFDHLFYLKYWFKYIKL